MSTWTLSDLADAAADALARLPAPANGQVRAVPDVRTLRWYGQLGLLDRPNGWRGRAGIYGERHLRQVIAIKRLQAEGWAIDEIQATLLGATDDQLLAWSAGVAPARSTPPAPAPVAVRERTAFWAAPAAPVEPLLRRIALGQGADLLLPADLDHAGLDAALAPLRAWLARPTPEDVP